jgi:AcrR family transcriptional regulator
MKRETTQQAAARLGLTPGTLYRRFSQAVQRGALTIQAGDYVAGRLFLTQDSWNLIHHSTPPQGRPRGKARG